MMTDAFDPDFASPADWGIAYRALNLNVIPATEKKHPVVNWKEFQQGLVPLAVFDRWYGPDGEYSRSYSMGFLTGPASLGEGEALLGIDCDAKEIDGRQTWQGWLDVHENGIEPETWKARTGSGGRHIFFRYPSSITIRNAQGKYRGIDVRAEGGFIMAAPSSHYIRGTHYEWEEGCDPLQGAEIADAPQWLIEICQDIQEAPRAEAGERVEASGSYDAWGNRTDGREAYMRDVVWAAVLDLHRASPIKPGADESLAAMQRAYETYARNVRSRIAGDNEVGLEREGRGLSLFQVKWDVAMRQWDRKVAEQAALPRKEEPRPYEPPSFFMPHPGHDKREDRFPFETVDDLRQLPPQRWLVEKWIPETAVGIFYGQWGTGKSFIGFDLMLHLAYGMQAWHGAALPGEPLDVLMIAREGHQGFVGRVDAFKRHHGISDDPPHLRFMRAAVSFMRDDEFKALCEAIQATGIQFRLIVVDTVARVLAGVDTNEQQAVTLFMERCAILGRITNASVIGVHHQNKSGTMLGSIYFEANSDFVFEVSRPDEEGPLTRGEILCTKMKDGQDRWKRSVAFHLVNLNPLNPDDTSLVVERIGESAPEPTGKGELRWPDKHVCTAVLVALEAAWNEGHPWTPSHVGKTFGTYAVENIMRDFSLPRETVKDMLGQWQKNLVLSVEERDSRTKRKGLKVDWTRYG